MRANKKLILVLTLLAINTSCSIDSGANCNPFYHNYTCSDPETHGFVVNALWAARNITGNTTFGMRAESLIFPYVSLVRKNDGVDLGQFGLNTILLALWTSYEMTGNETYTRFPHYRSHLKLAVPMALHDTPASGIALLGSSKYYGYDEKKNIMNVKQLLLGVGDFMIFRVENRGFDDLSPYESALFVQGLLKLSELCRADDFQDISPLTLNHGDAKGTCDKAHKYSIEFLERKHEYVFTYDGTPLAAAHSHEMCAPYLANSSRDILCIYPTDHAAMALAFLHAQEYIQPLDANKSKAYMDSAIRLLASGIRFGCNPNGPAIERLGVDEDGMVPDYHCESMKDWAWMVMAYAEAYKVTGNETYKESALRFIEDARRSASQAPSPSQAPASTLANKMLRAQIMFYGGLVLALMFGGLAIYLGLFKKERGSDVSDRAGEGFGKRPGKDRRRKGT